jgi:hypothetical protein
MIFGSKGNRPNFMRDISQNGVGGDAWPGRASNQIGGGPPDL